MYLTVGMSQNVEERMVQVLELFASCSSHNPFSVADYGVRATVEKAWHSNLKNRLCYVIVSI